MNSYESIMIKEVAAKYRLSEHYTELMFRYCSFHKTVTEFPIGRAIAKFMLLWNKKHSAGKGYYLFSDKAINFYYYY